MNNPALTDIELLLEHHSLYVVLGALIQYTNKVRDTSGEKRYELVVSKLLAAQLLIDQIEE